MVIVIVDCLSVIPAKAGIQRLKSRTLGPRLRGDDD